MGESIEIKDTCIKYMINTVPSQYNVKIILNLKMGKTCRDYSPNIL